MNVPSSFFFDIGNFKKKTRAHLICVIMSEDEQFIEYSQEGVPIHETDYGIYPDTSGPVKTVVHWVLSDTELVIGLSIALFALILFVVSLYHCIHYCYYCIRPAYYVPSTKKTKIQ